MEYQKHKNEIPSKPYSQFPHHPTRLFTINNRSDFPGPKFHLLPIPLRAAITAIHPIAAFLLADIERASRARALLRRGVYELLGCARDRRVGMAGVVAATRVAAVPGDAMFEARFAATCGADDDLRGPTVDLAGGTIGAEACAETRMRFNGFASDDGLDPLWYTSAFLGGSGFPSKKGGEERTF